MLGQCHCKSMFKSFLAVFSTSYLLCTKNLLNEAGEREQRMYDNWGQGWIKEAPEASSSTTFTWSTKDLDQSFGFEFKFDGEGIPKTLDEFLSKYVYDGKTNTIVINPKYNTASPNSVYKTVTKSVSNSVSKVTTTKSVSTVTTAKP